MPQLIISLALLACHPKTADSATTPPPDARPPECDPVVTVPAGLLPGGDTPVAATPHANIFGDAPSPLRVHLGVPSRDLTDSVSFLWSTDLDTLASLVELGPADTYPEGTAQVEGYSFLYGGPNVGEGSRRVHEIRLCDTLLPDTAYTYRVGGEGHWSDPYTFRTAPTQADTLRVVMAGDSRGNYETWAQIAAAIDAQDPDLILFSGDLINLGANLDEWDQWLDASGDMLARRHMVVAHGNHEFLAQAYFALFGLPGNEEWYAIDNGPLHLVVLNDTVRDPDQISEDEVAFIDEEFASSDKPWRWVMHHQPAYSVNTTHGSFAPARDDWVPRFEAAGVQLVVNGHNHTYERSVPIMADAEVAPSEGPVYVVTGGAGAPLYGGAEEHWFNAVNNPVYHYIVADVSAAETDVRALGLDGTTIDLFTVLP